MDLSITIHIKDKDNGEEYKITRSIVHTPQPEGNAIDFIRDAADDWLSTLQAQQILPEA